MGSKDWKSYITLCMEIETRTLPALGNFCIIGFSFTCWISFFSLTRVKLQKMNAILSRSARGKTNPKSDKE